VSVFTRWGDDVDQVWVKSRVPDTGPAELFGAVPSAVDRHPILGLDAVSCTPQLGVPGPWWDRLPHFRIGFQPSSGDELQSEYFVARRHAGAANSVHARRPERAPSASRKRRRSQPALHAMAPFGHASPSTSPMAFQRRITKEARFDKRAP